MPCSRILALLLLAGPFGQSAALAEKPRPGVLSHPERPAAGAVASWIEANLDARALESDDALPGAGRFQEPFGVGLDAPGHGLTLQDVTPVRRTLEGRPRLIIEGVVANASKSERPVPVLRGSLHDASGRELVAWYFSTELKTLSPGERTSFYTLAPSRTEGAAELTIDFTAESPQDGRR